ncbi:MAG: type III secretion inner membrane ring lipoprotein SctJ [Succinivibrio sp.]|nr:type III secretion inner membrane ring lipoprotein SctJ [Succinivibrio sp.]
MKRFVCLCMVLATVLITGCKDSLYSGISEKDANEMLSALLRRGVDAEKVSEGKGLYYVAVEHDDMIRALDIIRENSLPRIPFKSLGTVFSGDSMISSQLEEQARFAYALSQELSDTFSKIDGVLDSRVHVTLVQHEQSSGITTPPSAAVFLRHTPNSPVVNMVGEIRETTAKAVPGLTRERVTVMLEDYREKIFPPSLKTQEWYENPVTMIGFGMGGALLLVVIAVAVLFKLKYISFGKFGNKE